jgi:hypothetical protein
MERISAATRIGLRNAGKAPVWADPDPLPYNTTAIPAGFGRELAGLGHFDVLLSRNDEQNVSKS